MNIKCGCQGEYDCSCSADISSAVQGEVARIREMIASTKALLPNSNISFAIYELILQEADRAVREQDVVALVRMLPELKEIK